MVYISTASKTQINTLIQEWQQQPWYNAQLEETMMQANIFVVQYPLIFIAVT